tara:strand:+ start:122 stop:562 length:441 start_codon:yes stop_codon:yes gene_type:complete
MYTKKNGRMTYKTNRRPNFKRNNNYSSSKSRNKGNVTQQYNKYLKLAKDTFSAGDRIQSEYYYQFTDHYYRLMQELGINFDDQDSSLESRDQSSEKIISQNEKENLLSPEEETETNKEEDDAVADSIESIPFISEPVKKKRTKSSK